MSDDQQNIEDDQIVASVQELDALVSLFEGEDVAKVTFLLAAARAYIRQTEWAPSGNEQQADLLDAMAEDWVSSMIGTLDAGAVMQMARGDA